MYRIRTIRDRLWQHKYRDSMLMDWLIVWIEWIAYPSCYRVGRVWLVWLYSWMNRNCPDCIMHWMRSLLSIAWSSLSTFANESWNRRFRPLSLTSTGSSTTGMASIPWTFFVTCRLSPSIPHIMCYWISMSSFQHLLVRILIGIASCLMILTTSFSFLCLWLPTPSELWIAKRAAHVVICMNRSLSEL